MEGLLPAAAVAALPLVATCLAGCGNEGARMIPMEKKRDEMTRDSEQLPGIPVKDAPKSKRR
ncbi:hypothetical protein [Aquisphaera giovannonii]|nr:hypothetical protein [Aquisphaera giovannonii]